MITLTQTAVGKVKEILGAQDPKPAGLRISVVGGVTPESYGGVDWSDRLGVNDTIWASGADMINTSTGSHGIMGIDFVDLPTDPTAVVGPFSAIPYDPNAVGDPKGIGGDVEIIGRARPICTGEFVTASVDTNFPSCNHPSDALLTAGLPIADAQWCWNLDSSFPGAFYWLLASFNKPAQPYVFFGVCNIWPDLFSLYQISVGVVDGNGDASGCAFISGNPGLIGLEFVMQARVCDPNFVGPTPIPGISDAFSNGVCLKIGCP